MTFSAGSGELSTSGRRRPQKSPTAVRSLPWSDLPRRGGPAHPGLRSAAPVRRCAPCLRTFSSPAIVRSLIRIRSCLAIVARMLSTASLKIPQLSRYCSVRLAAPHSLNQSSAGPHISETFGIDAASPCCVTKRIAVKSLLQSPVGALRRSVWRPLLILAILASFTGAQDASPELLHKHSHSSGHQHCCPSCHNGGSSAVLHAVTPHPTPTLFSCAVTSIQVVIRAALPGSAASSRAPPA